MSYILLNATQMPNPLTPMVFVPPDVASQLMTIAFISVGSTAVLIWDIWDNICGDYRLLTEYRINAPTVVYFISRLSSLYYGLAYTILNTAATSWDCVQFEKAVSFGFSVGVSTTSLLFLLRIIAIFNRDKRKSIFFICLWILVVISSLTGFFGTSAVNIGPTKYCAVDKFEEFVVSAAIVPLVYDTLVFIAISRRLMVNALIIDNNMRTYAGIKALVMGKYLPAFSRSLLQDGQIYYLTTVTTNVTTVIILFAPGIPSQILRTMLTAPNLTLMNIMACRVFRNTKFGIFREASISTSMVLGEYARGGNGIESFKTGRISTALPSPSADPTSFQGPQEKIEQV